MLKINLKKILREKNMTLSDLSRATGISLNAISAFANSKSTAVQFGTLEKILTVLDIPATDLFEVVKSLVKLTIEPINPKETLEENTLEVLQYRLIAQYIDTKETEEILLEVNVYSCDNGVRRNHLFSYLSINEDVEKNYLALNIKNNNSSVLKAIDFLVVHELNSTHRLPTHDHYDLYMFDYCKLIDLYTSGSYRITTVGNETDYNLLDFIEYIADPGIDEIVLDENNKFKYINIFL